MDVSSISRVLVLIGLISSVMFMVVVCWCCSGVICVEMNSIGRFGCRLCSCLVSLKLFIFGRFRFMMV